jgi:hypothetical protein
MSEEPPRLRRKLLGYSPRLVERLIQERDSMLGVAEDRVKGAEARLTALEEQLRARDQVLAQLTAKLETLPSQPPPQPEHEPAMAEAMAEELTRVVSTAEASTSRIIHAWEATQLQIQEADRLWREVQDEIRRFSAWRQEVEPMIRDLQEAIHDARARIEDVPHRVEQALTPAAEAMAHVGDGMARFAESSPPPMRPDLGAQGGADRGEEVDDHGAQAPEAQAGERSPSEPGAAGQAAREPGIEYEDRPRSFIDEPHDGAMHWPGEGPPGDVVELHDEEPAAEAGGW